MKVTDDTKYVTCSRLPSLFCMQHPMAQTRNQYLAEVMSKRDGSWIEPEQNPHAKITDDIEDMMRNILFRDYPGLSLDPKWDRNKPIVSDQCPLGASCDDIMDTDGPVTFTDPNGDEFTFEGKVIVEYKSTVITSTDLPLYQGPLQVLGQMLCTGIKQALIMRWNKRTAKIEYFPMTWHESTIKEIASLAIDFWQRVEGKLDDPWYDPSGNEDLQLLYGHPSQDSVDLDEDVDFKQALIDYKKADETIKINQEIKDNAQFIMQKSMKNATTATAAGHVISWGTRKFKAQPEKVVPAKDAYEIRSKSIKVREINDKKEN
jgi:hypothetical protein